MLGPEIPGDSQHPHAELAWTVAAPPARDFYTVPEAAARLGVSRETIWRWIDTGRLPACRLGDRTVGIRPADLEQPLARTRPARFSKRQVPRAAISPHDELAEPGHWVQFYERDDYLVRVVGDFLGQALRAGAPALVIATEQHREAFEAFWTAEGLDLSAAHAAGRYLALDAGELLSSFMRGPGPDPDRFAEVVDRLLDRTRASRACPRVFGEMVALLALEGNRDAAVRLEQLWNGAQRRHRFSLLCAYPMAQLAGHRFERLVESVCSEHQQVSPAESYTALEDPDDRLRQSALLQQKACSLEAEIADRKRAEEREGAARKSAEAAVRLREEFLSIASHELRTPLTTLTAYAQLALRRIERDGVAEPDRLVQALQAITGQARTLSRLMAQLLDISRLEVGRMTLEPQAIDLVKLTEQAIAAARMRSSRHTITLEAPLALELQADPLRLEQVLANLLDNAVKYSPDGEPIEVALAGRADEVVLSVRDHGLGIPVEKRERLFERFYQAHGDGHNSGFGLGLYICREIATLHGGEIAAEFPPDGGTRLLLRLPREVVDSNARTAREALVSASGSSQGAASSGNGRSK